MLPREEKLDTEKTWELSGSVAMSFSSPVFTPPPMPTEKILQPVPRRVAALLAVCDLLQDTPSVSTIAMLGTPERSPLLDWNMLFRQ